MGTAALVSQFQWTKWLPKDLRFQDLLISVTAISAIFAMKAYNNREQRKSSDKDELKLNDLPWTKNEKKITDLILPEEMKDFIQFAQKRGIFNRILPYLSFK